MSDQPDAWLKVYCLSCNSAETRKWVAVFLHGLPVKIPPCDVCNRAVHVQLRKDLGR